MPTKMLDRKFCNGRELRLCVYYEGDNYGPWLVRTPNAWENGEAQEFETLEDAQKDFAEQVIKWCNIGNQDLQDEYDARHGTINGYATWQYEEYGK